MQLFILHLVIICTSVERYTASKQAKNSGKKIFRAY